MQPDRVPNPHAYEAKHAQQPVHVEPEDAMALGPTDARLRLTNRFDFLPLEAALGCSWFLLQDGATVASGNTP